MLLLYTPRPEQIARVLGAAQAGFACAGFDFQLYKFCSPIAHKTNSLEQPEISRSKGKFLPL